MTMANQVSVVNGKVVVKTPEGERLRQDESAAVNNPLESLTLSQALTWIDSNVNDLASARAALKHLAKLVFIVRARHNARR
jgi:hypothetical protein